MFKVEDTERVEGLSISPVGVVGERGKVCVVHDLTFVVRGVMRVGSQGGRQTQIRISEQVPGCEFGGVLETILKRILGLRAKFRVVARIGTQKVDGKSAFRQVGVDPNGTSRFAYHLGQFLFVYLFL